MKQMSVDDDLSCLLLHKDPQVFAVFNGHLKTLLLDDLFAPSKTHAPYFPVISKVKVKTTYLSP